MKKRRENILDNDLNEKYDDDEQILDIHVQTYNRISDAIEDETNKKMNVSQNKIILQNAKDGSRKINIAIFKRFFNFHKSLSFIDRSYPIGGFISCILIFISIMAFLYCILISIKFRGNVGLKVGFLGIFSFIVALFAMIIGVKSFKERDKEYVFSKIGSYISLFVVFMWILIYLRGKFML